MYDSLAQVFCKRDIAPLTVERQVSFTQHFPHGRGPKIPSRDRILQGAVEQIFDVPVPEMVEQLVKLPKTVSEDGIQQRTVERIADVPVPQDVEELAETCKIFLSGQGSTTLRKRAHQKPWYFTRREDR